MDTAQHDLSVWNPVMDSVAERQLCLTFPCCPETKLCVCLCMVSQVSHFPTLTTLPTTSVLLVYDKLKSFWGPTDSHKVVSSKLLVNVCKIHLRVKLLYATDCGMTSTEAVTVQRASRLNWIESRVNVKFYSFCCSRFLQQYLHLYWSKPSAK